jgi:hypothetical protein
VLSAINPEVIARADQLAARFAPRALNEDGKPGNKSVVEKIRELGPAYAALDDLVQSAPFLDLVGRITGIAELLYDPYYFGGGTHENRTGQDLDPHVDFNRHPIEKWHRRLNLIVYLNPEWRDDWGGSLELHSDPYRDDDRVLLVTPTYNRCVIFETTETSWHGFSRIAPPSPDTTRRSIALYFYTRERPAAETADPHSTVYVDRPLPPHLHAGHVLSDEDMNALRILVRRRDEHAQRLYRDLQRLERERDDLRAVLDRGRLGRLLHYGRRALARLSRRGG